MTRRACILDASLILSLGKAGHLDLLFETTELHLYVAPTALDELLSPETRAPIDDAIADGRLQVLRITSDDADELVAITEWRELVDAGEAEAIGVALVRGWLVGLEDLAAQKYMARHGHAEAWVNCAQLLRMAISAGRLSVAEADAIFRSLDVYPGYARRGIISVADL